MKVVKLDTRASMKAETVDRLRELLGQAERGELVDIAFSGMMADGGLITGFTTTEDAPRRLASVARLLHRLHVAWDGDE